MLASFGGTRRDKLIAHLVLPVIGSVVLITGTAVSGTAWLAAIIAIAVAFGTFREHLHHPGQHAAAVPVPAQHVAELRRTPGGAERHPPGAS